ncbi:hypothetical protein AB1Y20_018092 [Prymnesium parvum]|uniref:Uncharacterized protein n=1 Tax=Prymnesium parvum TaxID=97485 RepID=A0AB34JPP2_PRYPA
MLGLLFAASMAAVQLHTPPPAARRQPPRAAVVMGWADAQRKMREQQAKAYEQRTAEQQKAAAAAALRREEEAEEARARKEADARRAAEYVDNLDFRYPGGVATQPTSILTREGIANAQRLNSPAILAEQALLDAMKRSGEIPAAQMKEELQRLMEKATVAGVSEASPAQKQAKQLLGVLSASLEAASAPADPMDDAVNAIFGEYVMPEDVDDAL